jgi:cobyrinic acid a,c-diamide synthase
MSVYRHRENCMPEEIAQAQEARGKAHGLDVLEQLRAANTLVIGVIHRTAKTTINAQQEGLTPAEAREEQRRQDALVLQAADRWHKQIELAAKIQGEMAPDTLNITVEIAQAAVEDGHARDRAWREQRGIVPGKPHLLDAG